MRLLLTGTREVVAESSSQLPAVGEEVEGQQNRGEAGQMGVKVVEQTRVWGLAQSPEEELAVGGLG